MSSEISYLTVGEVGLMYGVSATRIRQLDFLLAPIRTSSGIRLYDPRVCDQILAQRDASRVERGR